MSFPEPEQFNGSDMRPMSSADGTPTVYRCLICDQRLTGSIARADHFYTTTHARFVPNSDPRFTQPTTDSEVA